MNTMIENSTKGKSEEKSKATKSAPITNGVRSTIKKQRKSLQDNVVQMVKKVVSLKKVPVEPENSSSQENGVSSHGIMESDDISPETIQESTEPLKRVNSRKRKTPPLEKTQKQAKTDSQPDNAQNNIVVLVEPEKDAEEKSALEHNKETSRSLKRVQVSHTLNLSSIDEEENSKTVKPSQTKNDKLILDGQVQENSNLLKRNPSGRGKKSSLMNGESEQVELVQVSLDVPKTSRTVKRVPSRKGSSNISNENKSETVQPTTDVQENPPSDKNVPEIHIESESDKMETQPKSKPSSKVRRASSLRTNSKKVKTSEMESTSGEIPESLQVLESEPKDNEVLKPEINKTSRTVKRVPSRRKTSIISNENKGEIVHPTSDVQEKPSSKITPEIHIDSENDKIETQSKSKTSNKAKRASSLRTNSKKVDSETYSTSGDIPENSKLQVNVQALEADSEDIEALKPDSVQESSNSLKGVTSPRKRKAPVVKEKSNTAKSTNLTVTVQEPSSSQKVPQTAKRQKLQELPVPPINSIHGTVFVMGENEVGQLGLSPDDMDRKTRPFQLELPYSIVEVAAGGMHSVCLTTNGEVITFGCNDEGALGRITNDESPEYLPKKVDIPERIVKISAADSHTAALAESGQVYIWGNFRRGDGAMGLTRNGLMQNTPMKILQGVKIVMISSGSEHLICLSSNGVVYSCGAGESGQLGRFSSRNAPSGGRGGIANLVEPAQLFVTKSGRSPAYMDKVWTGAYNTFMREKGTGTIYACGLNNYEHLGFSSTEAVYVPKKVESFNNNVWQYIHGGMHHTLTLDDSGKVYSIGRKEYGRLGLGENCDDAKVPTIIPTLEEEKCIDISCGDTTSYAVTEEGSAFSWGFGTSYQLGHGNDEDCFIPTKIAGRFQESWKPIRISGGGQHALILACRK